MLRVQWIAASSTTGRMHCGWVRLVTSSNRSAMSDSRKYWIKYWRASRPLRVNSNLRKPTSTRWFALSTRTRKATRPNWKRTSGDRLSTTSGPTCAKMQTHTARRNKSWTIPAFPKRPCGGISIASLAPTKLKVRWIIL